MESVLTVAVVGRELRKAAVFLVVLLLVSLSCLGERANDGAPPAGLPRCSSATLETAPETTLTGYGLVVGLSGTGDRSLTVFGAQTLQNILQGMGVTLPATAVSVTNVALVCVTASLPVSSRPGTRMDVRITAMGDATSLSHGTLMRTLLYADDGEVYGEAQGSVTFDGVSGEARATQADRLTNARVLEGGLVQRDIAELQH